ncbi:MAG: hypothetical protein AB7G93_10775 [Bdellovibrionales bacterium]
MRRPFAFVNEFVNELQGQTEKSGSTAELRVIRALIRRDFTDLKARQESPGLGEFEVCDKPVNLVFHVQHIG